jgi:hypothetical protein
MNETTKPMLWTGRALTGFFVLFMLMDISIKLLRLPVVDATMAELGWAAGSGFWIGVMELVLVALYLIPRTALLGAVLLTGLFGATAATHLRLGNPLFSHVLFGVYLALFAWGGLWLRDASLRAVFPLRR